MAIDMCMHAAHAVAGTRVEGCLGVCVCSHMRPGTTYARLCELTPPRCPFSLPRTPHHTTCTTPCVPLCSLARCLAPPLHHVHRHTLRSLARCLAPPLHHVHRHTLRSLARCLAPPQPTAGTSRRCRSCMRRTRTSTTTRATTWGSPSSRRASGSSHDAALPWAHAAHVYVVHLHGMHTCMACTLGAAGTGSTLLAGADCQKIQ